MRSGYVVINALTCDTVNTASQDNESHFHAALTEWQQLNLSGAFLNFAKKATPLSASLPLLLHHSQDVTLLWLESIQKTDDEGLKPLLE